MNFEFNHPENLGKEATIGNSATSHAEFAVHDTMRFGYKEYRHELIPGHALETHLKTWNGKQNTMKSNMHRQVYGLHAPFKAAMEHKILSQNHTTLPVLPSSNLSLHILQGTDESIEEGCPISGFELEQDKNVHNVCEVALMGLKMPL